MILDTYTCLPIHPKPYPLESYTSYIVRLMEANGITKLRYFSALMLPDYKTMTMSYFMEMPTSFGALPSLAHCSLHTLRNTTPWFLLQKFGRPISSASVFRFLGNSMTSHRRYCPSCLKEANYYRLHWQFHQLPGCSHHQCLLHDTCEQCGQLIPLITHQPRIGICPHCFNDLTYSSTLPLNTETLKATVDCEPGLTYLLTPPATDTGINDPKMMRLTLSHVLKTVREANELTRQDIAQMSNVPEKYINYIEYGRLNTTFNQYLSVIRVQGLTTVELLQKSLECLQTFWDQRCASNHPDANELRFYFQQLTMVAQVEDRIAQLKERNTRITQKAVIAELKLNSEALKRFPKVRELIQQHAATSSLNRPHERQQEEELLLEQVRAVLSEFSLEGETATVKVICERMQISTARIYRSPRVRQLLAQEIQGIKRQQLDPQIQEQQLLERIQSIQNELEQQGQQLTLRVLRKSLKCSHRLLKRFPRVWAYLEQHVPTIRPAMQKNLHLREHELFTQVSTAIVTLREQQQPVTLQRICSLVNVGTEQLQSYPKVRELLQQELDYSRNKKTRAEQSVQREEHLFMLVQQAIVALRAQSDPITYKHVAEKAGVSCSKLVVHQRIRDFIAEQRAQELDLQRTKWENQLLTRAKHTINVMETSNVPVTWTGLAASLACAIGTLKKYSAVRATIERAIKDTLSLRNHKHFTEEQIWADVRAAVEQLRAADAPLSIERIIQTAHYSIPTVNQYHDIKAWIAIQCADDRNRRRQQKEADLVAKVADAIAHLQETNQFITWDTIAHYLEMQRCSLVATGRRYPRIRELIDEASSS